LICPRVQLFQQSPGMGATPNLLRVPTRRQQDVFNCSQFGDQIMKLEHEAHGSVAAIANSAACW
jgi:hypothetical protein